MNFLDPHEMMRYFSDFLTQINLIITNIKHHTYEIIDVSIPSTTILKVYHSMASIISSTHHTYDDLKRIESVMTGIVKAKRIKDRQQPETPMVARIRCRSSDGNLNPRQHKSKNEEKLNSLAEEANKQSQIRTIKRSDLSKELKLQLPYLLGKEDTHKNEIRQNMREEDKITVKYVTQRGSQPSSDRGKPLMNMKKWLQQRIEKIVASNRVGVAKIMSSNSQCLRLVRSAKKQITAK